MPNSAYVIGELTWPMPDPGLVAVWRAMSVDGSQWDDWGDFDQGAHAGNVGALVDAAALPGLALDEQGVKLRALLTDAALWQQLVVAWRAAADLGATGELVWCAEQQDRAYRVTVREYASQWERLSADAVAALGIAPAQPAVTERAATAKPIAPAKRAATAKPIAPAKRAATAKPVALAKRATTAKPAEKAKPAAKAKPAVKAKPAKAKRAAKKRR